MQLKYDQILLGKCSNPMEQLGKGCWFRLLWGVAELRYFRQCWGLGWLWAGAQWWVTTGTQLSTLFSRKIEGWNSYEFIGFWNLHLDSGNWQIFMYPICKKSSDVKRWLQGWLCSLRGARSWKIWEDIFCWASVFLGGGGFVSDDFLGIFGMCSFWLVIVWKSFSLIPQTSSKG